MGHCRVLLGVDPDSLAMARSFRRGSASDTDSSHETVCSRAIGVRNFTYLRTINRGTDGTGQFLRLSPDCPSPDCPGCLQIVVVVTCRIGCRTRELYLLGDLRRIVL